MSLTSSFLPCAIHSLIFPHLLPLSFISYFLKCHRRGQLHRQVERFSEKGIPICVEVLLAPDCQHGARKADILEYPGEEKDTLLLEKWDIIVSPKR